MTTNDRIVLEIPDFKYVRFECGKCGAGVVLEVARWDRIPHECPGCQDQWLIADGEPFISINRLRMGLLNLRQSLSGSGGSSFTVKFEIDKSEAK